jgi:hypothetical protein
MSMVNALQFLYGEDGMDGAFIKRQNIDMFRLNNEEFEHNYQIDVTLASLLTIGDSVGSSSSLTGILVNPIISSEPPPNCPKRHPDLPH